MLKALRFGLVYKVYPELKAFRDMSHYWRLWNIVNMIPSRLNLPRSGLSVEIGGIKVRTSRTGWNYKKVKRKYCRVQYKCAEGKKNENQLLVRVNRPDLRLLAPPAPVTMTFSRLFLNLLSSALHTIQILKLKYEHIKTKQKFIT